VRERWGGLARQGRGLCTMSGVRSQLLAERIARLAAEASRNESGEWEGGGKWERERERDRQESNRVGECV
jgi:hypothetical protein